MGNGIPLDAVWVFALVIFYSISNLTLVILLVCLLWSFGERLTYISMLCSFTGISTIASIVQQIHYALDWRSIKQSQFERAIASVTKAEVTRNGAAKISAVLFYIQFYCYNVQALIVFFWAVALFNSAWGFRSNWLGGFRDRIGFMSKVFAILFPVVIVALEQSDIVRVSIVAFFLVSYTTMLTSMTFGSILLALMLYKYIKTRRLVVGSSRRRGGWWGSASKQTSSDRSGIDANGTMDSGGTTNTRTSIYDRVLVTRFTIGFVVLAVFEVVLIVFSLFTTRKNAAVAASGRPDLSVSGTVVDVVLFVPGVTPALITFLVFGTTKSWRQYRDMVFGSCCIRRRVIEQRSRRAEQGERTEPRLEFTRLSSLPGFSPTRPQDESTGKKAEDRVRMFVNEVDPIDREIEAPSSQFDFSEAGPSYSREAPTALAPMSTDFPHSNQIGIGVTSPVHDPTIQPGRRREAWELDELDAEGAAHVQPWRFGVEKSDALESSVGVLAPPLRPLTAGTTMSREEERWHEWSRPKGDGMFLGWKHDAQPRSDTYRR